MLYGEIYWHYRGSKSFTLSYSMCCCLITAFNRVVILLLCIYWQSFISKESYYYFYYYYYYYYNYYCCTAGGRRSRWRTRSVSRWRHTSTHHRRKAAITWPSRRLVHRPPANDCCNRLRPSSIESQSPVIFIGSACARYQLNTWLIDWQTPFLLCLIIIIIIPIIIIIIITMMMMTMALIIIIIVIIIVIIINITIILVLLWLSLDILDKNGWSRWMSFAGVVFSFVQCCEPLTLRH